MSIAVVVPRGGDCPQRERIFQWVRDQYHRVGLTVVEGWHDGDWCKAAAVADALRRTNADVLVVADGDCWAAHIGEAILAVAEGAPWAMPHMRVHRLRQQATEQVLDGEPFSRRLRTERVYEGIPGGGITVLARTTYEQVPLDGRFVGWGGEDYAWGVALTRLAGVPYRPHKPLWHLWHPPQDGRYRIGRNASSDIGEALRRRYITADDDELRTLIEEARCSVTPPSSSSATAPRRMTRTATPT